MKFLRSSWYETQENNKCTVSPTTLQGFWTFRQKTFRQKMFRQNMAADVSAKSWRRTFRQKNMPKRLRLKLFAETFRMICGAYPVFGRSHSPSQRPAPTTIASRSALPLGLCSCSTSFSKMGI